MAREGCRRLNYPLMNQSYFTEEHEAFRESFRSFLNKEVVPHIDKWEKEGTIERFIWQKFADMGYLGLSYPEAYGGLGLDFFLHGHLSRGTAKGQ